jgi:hypothetical protein
VYTHNVARWPLCMFGGQSRTWHFNTALVSNTCTTAVVLWSLRTLKKITLARMRTLTAGQISSNRITQKRHVAAFSGGFLAGFLPCFLRRFRDDWHSRRDGVCLGGVGVAACAHGSA